MSPRKPGILLLLTFLSASSADLFCQAQQAQPVAAIRYHVGDDPDGKSGWTNPNFDDGAWPIAQNGLVPSRSRETNRFQWVRIRVQVPNNVNAPMALHLDGLGVQPTAWQVFVNGQAIGGQGDFPPHANPADPPVSPVMNLPLSLVEPGSVALVAVREWYAPAFIEAGVPGHPTAAINRADVLSLTARAEAADALVANGAGVCPQRSSGARRHRVARFLARLRRPRIPVGRNHAAEPSGHCHSFNRPGRRRSLIPHIDAGLGRGLRGGADS